MTPKPRVLVCISMHPDALARLEQVADVDVLLWHAPGIAQTAGDYDGLIVYSPQVTPETIRAARRLKVIACHACSAEIRRAAQEHSIGVTLVPSLWATVADMTLALVFAAARMLPQAHTAIKAGLWGQTDLKVRFSGHDIFGKTLGIIGLGQIGAILARRVQGFDMRVLYYDIARKPNLERELHVEYRALEPLLAESDIVSILVPLNDATRGMIGEKQLRLMKKDAILVNTARGAIIDEPMLCRALQERWIAAAGLDVLVDEPIKPGNPLLTLDNVVLAPHLGGSTKECDLVLVENTIRVLQGQEPLV
ncbi:MAG: NAD(P)-binding domain-containing protein [Chloroflexi bacterium]|nr:NAD(P)-binding domain-containing protein [Chloroflexota bacterium]